VDSDKEEGEEADKKENSETNNSKGKLCLTILIIKNVILPGTYLDVSHM
jgi:hypothetical protein